MAVELEKWSGRLLITGVDAAGESGIHSVDPRYGVAVSVRRNDVPPLRELGAVAGGHVLEVLSHPKGQVVLIQNLRVGPLKLSELLYELIVAKHSIRVIRRIINDPTEAELSGGRADAQAED